MIIRVTIIRVRASREAVTVDVKLTAVDGPFAGQFIERERVYTHPTTSQDIVGDLTDRAIMLKASFGAAQELKDMEWEV